MHKTQGGWAWFLHRVAGIGLVFALGIHFWVTHYASPTEVITFGSVNIRLQSLLFIVVDWTLLSLGIFHGLNGLRNIIFDYSISEKAKHRVTWGLVIFGVTFFIYGAYGLFAFMQIKGY